MILSPLLSIFLSSELYFYYLDYNNWALYLPDFSFIFILPFTLLADRYYYITAILKTFSDFHIAYNSGLKSSPGTSSISWNLVRNANPWASSQTY